MMRSFLFAILQLCSTALWAQSDSTVFHAYLYNIEEEVYLRINLYDQNITIPGHELYGELPGFLGKEHNSFCWPIISAKMTSHNKAKLQMINDFGSEDATVTLTRKNDSTYVLQHVEGSVIRVPYKGKWRKLPKTLLLKRR
jgi:hypothetical protein